MSNGGVLRTTSFRVGPSVALPHVLRSLGHAPEAVFAEANVALEPFAHPENRIPAQDLGRLLVCAEDITGRTDIALLVVDSFRPQGLGLVGEIAAEGPDVETALKNIVRLLQYNTLAGYPVLAVADRTATMKFELRDADFPGAGFVLEGAAGILVRLLQWLCGEQWRPDEVRLCRREPADPRPFEAFFGMPIRFSSTEDAILFGADLLQRAVFREERRVATRGIEVVAAPYSELVRRQLAIRLGFAPLDAEAIADGLGISRRTLFRHLKGEGTTVQALVDDFRFARARHLLAAGDASLAEIAFALGFPEQSAFTRAFARWSGVPPGAWRRAGEPDSGRQTS